MLLGKFGALATIATTTMLAACAAAPEASDAPEDDAASAVTRGVGLRLGELALGQTPGLFGHSTAPNMTAFKKLTGTDPVLWEAFAARETWQNIEAPGWQFGPIQAWLRENPKKGLIYSFAPMPTSEGKGTGPLTKCANGEYNGHYAKFANFAESRGISDMILRVGWEWQGNYYPWGVANKVSDARLFAQCFRNVVTSIRRAYPGNHFLFDWNPTYGVKADVLPAAWPGDDYVDMVGVDVYDQHYGSCGGSLPCRWAGMAKNLEMVKRFAESHDKPLSIPEFGLWEGSHGAGDDPVFIENMCKFAMNPANRVAYFVYFNVDGASDHRLEVHPKSAAAYRRYCH